MISTARRQAIQKYIQTLTNDQLHRFYRKLYDRIAEGGGTCFGMQWSTIGQCYPEKTEAMKLALTEKDKRAYALKWMIEAVRLSL